MLQYDICKNTHPGSRKRVPYLIVLQANLLKEFATVVVAPLMAEGPATRIARLNPVIKVEGKAYTAVMTEMAGVLRSSLGETVARAQDRHLEFVAAIDLLFTGI